MQGGAVGRQAEGFAGEREDEFFHAGFAFGAFGDADQGDVQPEFFPYGYGDADLSFAAVNQYDIGPFDCLAVGFGLLHFAIAAGEDFAHGGVVVAGFGGGDVVAAVLRGLDVLFVVHDTGGDGGFALGVADVKAFEAVEVV